MLLKKDLLKWTNYDSLNAFLYNCVLYGIIPLNALTNLEKKNFLKILEGKHGGMRLDKRRFQIVLRRGKWK